MNLHTPAEAAEILHISVDRLKKLVSARQVPYTRVAGTRHTRFSDRDIEDIIAAGRVEPITVAPVLSMRRPARRTA